MAAAAAQQPPPALSPATPRSPGPLPVGGTSRGRANGVDNGALRQPEEAVTSGREDGDFRRRGPPVRRRAEDGRLTARADDRGSSQPLGLCVRPLLTVVVPPLATGHHKRSETSCCEFQNVVLERLVLSKALPAITGLNFLSLHSHLEGLQRTQNITWFLQVTSHLASSGLGSTPPSPPSISKPSWACS